ncbi:hypothetical protein HAZT_HAZT009517, partial [Hyalella azteca]
MGYNRCPKINSYWMTGDDIGVQCIKEATSRDRFYKILHHLHLNDNSKMDRSKADKLYKYRDAGHPMIALLDYRRELGTGLLTFSTKPAASCKRRRKSDFLTPASERLSNVGVHWPQFNVSRGRCQVCSKKGEEARPAVECEHCKVHLCCNSAENCFKEFH